LPRRCASGPPKDADTTETGGGWQGPSNGIAAILSQRLRS
jgi:hypothetical protein